jgi:hypothetical protein
MKASVDMEFESERRSRIASQTQNTFLCGSFGEGKKQCVRFFLASAKKKNCRTEKVTRFFFVVVVVVNEEVELFCETLSRKGKRCGIFFWKRGFFRRLMCDCVTEDFHRL